MRKKYLPITISVIFIIFVTYQVITHLKSNGKYLTVSGRVEADEIEITSRTFGELKSLSIKDGSMVKRGDIIAKIDDEELLSKLRQIIKAIAEVEEKIKAADLDYEYTLKNVGHSVNEAKKGLSIAEARLKQTEAKRENAEKERKRYLNLFEKGVISKEKYDTVKLSYELSEEEFKVASKEMEKANISLLKAEDSIKLVKAKEQELLAMNKSLGQLKETFEQVKINIGYTVIKTPSDGFILRKVAEVGENLIQGNVIAVMINPEEIYVKTYVPEIHIGKLHINMPASVFTDAYPDKPVKGYVCYISDESEFTPKEVQTYEERVKQVFMVKICFSHKKQTKSEGKTYFEILKKGMPVDVRFPIQRK